MSGDVFALRARIRYLEGTAPSSHESGDFLRQVVTHQGLRFLLAFFIATFFLFFIRSAHLQIVENQKFQTAAERNRVRLLKIHPERGVITDRNGMVVAGNSPQFVATVTPGDIPKNPDARALAIARMSALLNIPEDQIQKKIASGVDSPYERIELSGTLTYENAMLLLVESESIPGFAVGLESRRIYPLDETGRKIWSHVLGYAGALTPEEYADKKRRYSLNDIIGKTGIEASHEDDLRGEFGTRRVEVDASGKAIGVLAEDPARAGENLILSIDARLENALAAALEENLQRVRASRAAGVVLDPKTGEILAMVSLPGYDNAIFTGGVAREEYAALINDKDLPLFNRAISGEYPSGSIIKPLIATAALQEKIITASTQVLSVGGIRIAQWFFPDWKAGGHGLVSVRRALAESVNTFFYIAGGGFGARIGLGPERIGRYLDAFGLGRKTGIDLPGEHAGTVPTPLWKKETTGEGWYIGDTYHLAIGQGYLLVTPLQMAVATAAVANGGTLYVPSLVRGIEDPQTGVVQYHKPSILREKLANDANLAIVRAGMRDAVLWGSARRLAGLGIAAAGKTGTAQWSTTGKPHAWFVGFAPADDPQIAVSILLEEGGEGSDAAVPVAEAVFRAWNSLQQK